MSFRRHDLVAGCHDDGDGGLVGYGGLRCSINNLTN